MISLRALSAALALFAGAPAFAETVAITNAHIYSMGPAGEIASGTVLLRDGKIVAVGDRVATPAGARVIDAAGKVVTPGLVLSESVIGMVEVSQVRTTDDRGTRASRLSAGFDVQYGLNPNSALIPIARRGGVTRAVVTPVYDNRSATRELLFAGQAAVIDLAGAPRMVTKPKVGMVIAFGEGGAERSGGARGGELVLVRAALEETRAYMRNRAGYDRGEARPYELSKVDLEALIPVVTGQLPLIANADRASDIRDVLTLARDEKIKVIISGGDEAWTIGREIAAAGVPVLLDPLSDLPVSFAQVHATMENAARLQAAGVVIAIKANGGGGFRARELRYNAGNAVARGLPFAAGLAAITINPARIFGVADRVGSLEAGKDADLVIWTGDPLEMLTDPVAVFIAGVEQPMESRMEGLAERYREPEGPRPPAYR
jgi:imidazolonepropionase-like amidohydrolase